MGSLVLDLFNLFDTYLSPLIDNVEDKVFLEKSKAD